MCEIYGNAELTLLWLGESKDDSNLAMDLVANICDKDFEKYKPEDPRWLALFPLFKRAWWTRVWIIQEAMLSPHPVVKCGAKEVDHEKFVTLKYLHEKWRETDMERFAALRPFDGVPYRDLFWRDSKDWLNGTLGSWLASTRDFKSKVFRDRVYALLGLVKESSRAAINISYDKSVKPDREVVLEAGVLLFREEELLILQFAQEEKDPKLELLSWCPDWTKNITYSGLSDLGFFAYTLQSPGGKCAGGPCPGPWSPPGRVPWPLARPGIPPLMG